jgi:hypothetical protein
MLFELDRADANQRDGDGNPMKPHISGDVFTASESPAQVFKIGRSDENKHSATVEVICYWNDDTVGKTKKKVTVVLVSGKSTWLIDNVIEEDGWNIIADFSRKDYFSLNFTQLNMSKEE